MSDPYAVNSSQIRSLLQLPNRAAQLRQIVERHGYEWVEERFGEPQFRSPRGLTLMVDDLAEATRSDRGLQYDLYQAWQDVAHRGY